MRRPRVGFATRLLVGALGIVIVVLAGVSAFLLISRDRATRETAVGNAQNRAGVLDQLVSKITAVTGAGAVDHLAIQPQLATALIGADAATAVPALFHNGGYSSRGHFLVVLDAFGRLRYSSVPQGLPPPDATSPSVRAARTAPAAVAGVEVLGPAGGGQIVSVDVARRIVDGPGTVRGVIIDVAPLSDQLVEFAPVVGADYQVVFVAIQRPGQTVRLRNGSGVPSSMPEALAAGVSRHDASVNGTYDAPLAAGGSGEVAGALARLDDATGSPSGYLGVEVPTAVFAGSTRSDEVTLIFISLLVILGTSILVILFVGRFVRRPVARLERGVARIAGGDYATDIPVASGDELGRLAASVNRMRSQISTNVAEIEAQRARLDAAVSRLGGVSRALTTTREGVDALQMAVVRAATAITGRRTAAVLYARGGGGFVAVASLGMAGSPDLAPWGVVEDLLAGRAARVDKPPAGWESGGLLSLPMFYQGEVNGALAIFTAAGTAPDDRDLQALSVLANNAAVALENTRVFELEKETVRRLRELDGMKSDFLATVQHELRTPLTAIMGMSDLLEMCWQVWDDREKLDAVTDIQTASKNLYEIVETIIDFSLLERDTLGLQPQPTAVRPVVVRAVEAVADRWKTGLPVSVDIAVRDDTTVWADPDRFEQVLRALLDNAAKFSPAGSTVRLHAVVEGQQVRIDVVDQGVGIPADGIERIFDRFYQVDNTATRAFGGTGMGLALARRLVEASGARIVVESLEGRGSRFTLLWPATEASAIQHGAERTAVGVRQPLHVKAPSVVGDGHPVGAGVTLS